jgi:hypothetical protein
MNAIQSALARVAALKDALGSAAGKAGQFIGSEVQGTLNNLSPHAISQRWQDTANAPAATGAASIQRAFPGGMSQYAALQATEPPMPDSTNVLGDFIHGIVSAYQSITKKKK